MPERYEAGTLFTPAIASLCAGVNYIENIGIDNIHAHTMRLTTRIEDILSSFSDVKIYGAENGIITFNKGNFNSSDISQYLNKCDIATRAGYHCAPLIHQKMGTQGSGAVRISVSYFNTLKECDELYKAMKSII